MTKTNALGRRRAGLAKFGENERGRCLMAGNLIDCQLVLAHKNKEVLV